VKHGLVSRVGDWPFSPFHRDVSAGLFPQDWAGEVDATGEFGEAANGAIK
jgi:putative transposase